MDPATGLRVFPLLPHQTVQRLTPAADLFVLAHLGVPRIDANRWSLVIDGLVGRPVSLSLADLQARPKRIVEAVHQCCGSPLEPRRPTRRAANVRWGGTDLAELLHELGVDPRARFLWSFGADHGTFDGRGCDSYAKDLPLARLVGGDVLLAWELDGAPLSAEHGHPLRLVVPGFYGTNSVKWLSRLQLADRRADGLFTTRFYNDPTSDGPRPVWEIQPEALIVAPAPDAAVPLGAPCTVWGWAWSDRGVARVEVSTDGGRHWQVATLERRSGRSWQRYSFDWRPDRAGPAELCVRAVDVNGAGQPDDDARNAVHRVAVRIG
jgi:DMSO/TMAO reductase YedYZ molybdopterin-dependent catalytic subunit